MNFYMWDRLDKNKADCEIQVNFCRVNSLQMKALLQVQRFEEFLKVKDQQQSAQWLRGLWQGKQIIESPVRFQDKLITNPFLVTGAIKNHVFNYSMPNYINEKQLNLESYFFQL